MSQQILAMKARWDQIRIANLYDALDKMGYPNQCLDITIKPIHPGRRLAGIALTFQGAKGPLAKNEQGEEESGMVFFDRVKPHLSEGCVIVVDGGGEQFSGKMGEMTSWFFKEGGATGIVVDGYIRDYRGLEVIPNYTACARGTSPVESASRWRVASINEPIALPGTVTHQVMIYPGDWIIGGWDGVIVVPAAIAEEALEKAEAIEHLEEGMRQDLLNGMSFQDCFNKWGRG